MGVVPPCVRRDDLTFTTKHLHRPPRRSRPPPQKRVHMSTHSNIGQKLHFPHPKNRARKARHKIVYKEESPSVSASSVPRPLQHRLPGRRWPRCFPSGAHLLPGRRRERRGAGAAPRGGRAAPRPGELLVGVEVVCADEICSDG